jgi:hypothetical protein
MGLVRHAILWFLLHLAELSRDLQIRVLWIDACLAAKSADSYSAPSKTTASFNDLRF